MLSEFGGIGNLTFCKLNISSKQDVDVEQVGIIPIYSIEQIGDMSSYDWYLLFSEDNASEIYFKLIYDLRVEPTKIHAKEGVFQTEMNRIYKPSSKWSNIANKINIQGGFSNIALQAQVYDCMEYIAKRGIKGDIVNLGVWKGWSMKYFLLLLDHFGLSDKKVIGFDTFDGFVRSGGNDVYDVFFEGSFKGVNIEEVRNELLPHKNFEFIIGDVAETIHQANFENGVCLTLFDMDDYTPTACALDMIYKATNDRGFLIHDHFSMDTSGATCIGQRIAADEYNAVNYMLNISGTNIFQKI